MIAFKDLHSQIQQPQTCQNCLHSLVCTDTEKVRASYRHKQYKEVCRNYISNNYRFPCYPGEYYVYLHRGEVSTVKVEEITFRSSPEPHFVITIVNPVNGEVVDRISEYEFAQRCGNLKVSPET